MLRSQLLHNTQLRRTSSIVSSFIISNSSAISRTRTSTASASAALHTTPKHPSPAKEKVNNDKMATSSSQAGEKGAFKPVGEPQTQEKPG